MTKAGPKFAVSERTIRGWLCDETLTRDMEILNQIGERLARFCRRACVAIWVKCRVRGTLNAAAECNDPASGAKETTCQGSQARS
jgi:hypothetical protein